MKSLFVTLLILCGAFVAFDYFLAAPWERLVFERQAKPPQKIVSTALPPHEIEDSGPSMPSPKPSITSASDYVVKIPEIPSKDFVPPQVPSLEELTQNWSNIPAHAFPREVKLRTNVDVKMAAGSARIPAGAAAYARSADKGWLTVAPTPTSTASGTVAVADTDMQDQIRQSYEKWKAYRIEKARNAWLAKKTAKPMPKSAAIEPVATTSAALDETGKPTQSGDGSYPLLLASMSSGQVTEIVPPRIKRWGNAEQKVIKGEPMWTVDVWYETVVFCGPMVAQAQAQIRNGKVIAWMYPSGEEVP